MKKTDIAYLAGFFDGEGCVVIQKQDRNPRWKPTFSLHVNIASTNPWIIQKMRFNFGGYIRLKPKGKDTWLDCWHWTLSGKMAGEFLKLILPYLHLKKPQAEIAIQFIEVRKGAGIRLTNAERVIAEAQRLLIKNLKKERIK